MTAARLLRLIAASAAGLFVVAGATNVHAQELTVELKAMDSPKPKAKAEGKDGKDSEDEGPPPPQFIRGVISASPGLSAEDFILKTELETGPLELPASKAVTYRESNEPLGLVILIQGDYRWMGNETFVEPGGEDEVYPGAFAGLGSAIEALAGAGPGGSKGAVLVYGDATDAKVPMGDISQLTAAALGNQKDYEETITKSFIVGLQNSYKELVKLKGYRRVLVVISNGQDTKEDIGVELGQEVKQLKTLGVETYSIHYSNDQNEQGVQGPTNMKKLGYTKNYRATSRDHFGSNAKNIVEFINTKYYVDFTGWDLPYDGQEHEYTVAVGDDESEAQSVTLGIAEAPQPSGGGLWWLWMLIVGAVVLVVVVIIIIARRKPAPQPLPQVQMDVPPPEPAGPKKTVMFNVGGGESGYPVVGWIVPLSGPNQFQTFKLLQGATRIGTGGDVHIIIDDGFMSTTHCEIVCKQSGFILVDGGSTNGSFVNDRKISEHELVDNDQFILGKTPFKFKSIN